jgi:branched-chain amino acid transport system substrate-binding protein
MTSILFVVMSQGLAADPRANGNQFANSSNTTDDAGLNASIDVSFEEQSLQNPSSLNATNSSMSLDESATKADQSVYQSGIVIGVIAPLSGLQSNAGKSLRDGVDYASYVVNNSIDWDLPMAEGKGILSLRGAMLRLVYADDQGNSTIGAIETKRLIEEEKAVAIIGSYSSDVTVASALVAEQYGIPFICPISTASHITKAGLNWLYRTGPSEELFVRTTFDLISQLREEGHPVARLAVVGINNTYGRDFLSIVNESARERGFDIVAQISYDPEIRDFSNITKQLKEAGPAVLLQASYLPDSILSIESYKEMNYKPYAIITAGGGFIESPFIEKVGNDSELIFTRDAWSPQSLRSSPYFSEIADGFEKTYGERLLSNSGRAFVATLVLAEAINRASSTDPEKIRDALDKTNLSSNDTIGMWQGVRFDQKSHQNVLASSVVLQIQDGKYVMVWPPDKSSAKPSLMAGKDQ